MQDDVAAAADGAAHLARNVAVLEPRGALADRLAQAAREGRRLRVKLGIDPTAPDIHLGHVVVLQKLREFQDLGHRVVLIVGDRTASVGDPSGRSDTRAVLSPEEIDANARTYEEQALRVLRDEPDLLEVRRNSEWLDMPVVDFLALARIPKVAQLLAREDFAKRYADGTPISLLEFLYPLLQAYDSVAVSADVELGGTDQLFNLLLGRDVQRAHGQPEQVVLTMPLLVGLDGARKMSKSLGNAIGVAAPASEIYGRTLRIPDELIAPWGSLLAVAVPDASVGARARKRALARALTDRFAGDGAGATAEAAFDRVHVDRGLPDDVPELRTASLHVPALLAEAFGVSRSDARRALAQGGVRLDGEVLAADRLDLEPGRLDGAVLQMGKRRHARVRRGPAAG